MTQTYPAQHLPQTGFPPSPGPGGLPATTSPVPTGALAPASGMKRACAYLTDVVCIAAVAGLVWLLFPSLVIAGIVVVQMAVVFSLLRARTGRTPGALLTRTAAVAEGTSRAPGLKRQLIRSVLMTLLHLTVVGPLISILLGRDGRDWMDRVCGTADLRKPTASAEQAQPQGAFSPHGEFAAAQAFTPGHGEAVPNQPFTNPASPFPQSAPSANPVAPSNATPGPWTGAPRTQEPPVPSAFPAQGPWDQPSVPQSAPPIPAGNGYSTAAPQTPWGQPAPQTPTAVPQAPWGQPVPQIPAGHSGYDAMAPQALWNQPSAPQSPVWRKTAAPQAGPPQEPVSSGGPAGTGGASATGTPPPSTPGGVAVNRGELLGARPRQGRGGHATTRGTSAVESTPRRRPGPRHHPSPLHPGSSAFRSLACKCRQA